MSMRNSGRELRSIDFSSVIEMMPNTRMTVGVHLLDDWLRYVVQPYAWGRQIVGKYESSVIESRLWDALVLPPESWNFDTDHLDETMLVGLMALAIHSRRTGESPMGPYYIASVVSLTLLYNVQSWRR